MKARIVKPKTIASKRDFKDLFKRLSEIVVDLFLIYLCVLIIQMVIDVSFSLDAYEKVYKDMVADIDSKVMNSDKKNADRADKNILMGLYIQGIKVDGIAPEIGTISLGTISTDTNKSDKVGKSNKVNKSDKVGRSNRKVDMYRRQCFHKDEACVDDYFEDIYFSTVPTIEYKMEEEKEKFMISVDKLKNDTKLKAYSFNVLLNKLPISLYTFNYTGVHNIKVLASTNISSEDLARSTLIMALSNEYGIVSEHKFRDIFLFFEFKGLMFETEHRLIVMYESVCNTRPIIQIRMKCDINVVEEIKNNR